MITQAEGPVQNSGEGDETADTTGNGLCNYDGAGTDISAPLRVGFAATPATSRVSAGAGIYGNMEMSGNLWERCVTIGKSTGRAFQGTHGDGTLTTTASYEGNATNTDWPGIDATPERGVTNAIGAGFKGGSFNNIQTSQIMSARGGAAFPDDERDADNGNRCARTAP